jgi:hypothetical protein
MAWCSVKAQGQLYLHQNPEQSHETLTANKSFKNVAKLKFLGTMVTYQV